MVRQMKHNLRNYRIFQASAVLGLPPTPAQEVQSVWGMSQLGPALSAV